MEKKWTTIGAAGLIPVLFLPVTADYYDTNKWILLLLAAACILIVTGISFLIRKENVKYTISDGTLALGGLTVAALISLTLASTNKVEALVNPLGAVTFLALTILAGAAQSFSAQTKRAVIWSMYIGVSIINLIALYQFFGMGKIMFPDLPFLQNALWTPAGTTTTAIAVSCIALALLLPDILQTLKKASEQTAAALLVLAAFVIMAGTALTIWQFIPSIPTGVLPFSAAWTVTLESLKNGKAAVAGVGAENFVSAFTSGKPASLLNTPLWNIRFNTSADFFLHIATVYGLLGLAAALYLAYLLLRRRHYVALLVLVLFPPSLTLLTVIAVLLICSDNRPLVTKSFSQSFVRYAGALLSVILAGGMLYGAAVYYSGELAYFQAVTAAQKNDGKTTYNDLIAAIRTDTFLSRNHITFSQVNLSLANSLGATAKNNTDRALVSQLLQQGISEAKIAVTLNTQNIAAWENLGAVYQAVMGVATGADTWAAAAYQKALTLDPTNPILMVNLGGIYVHEKNYDNAIVAFNQATLLKPDYTNAYYNLGNAYTLKGDVTDAKNALTKTMSLVAPESSDYATVKNALDALQKNALPAPPTANSQLTLPE